MEASTQTAPATGAESQAAPTQAAPAQEQSAAQAPAAAQNVPAQAQNPAQTAGYQAVPVQLTQPAQAAPVNLSVPVEAPQATQQQPAQQATQADSQGAQPSAASLGYPEGLPFKGAIDLAVSMNMPYNVLAGAIGEDGKVDVAKLGGMKPQEAAILKASVENEIASYTQKVQGIVQQYHKAVGSEAAYNAMRVWVKQEAQSNTEFAKELDSFRDLISEGGHRGVLAIKELFSRFSKAAGTSMHTQVARAIIGNPIGQGQSPSSKADQRAKLDAMWAAAQNNL